MAEMVIRNRIRQLRFEAGEMTQQDLADSVGITRQTVIALEKEKYYPSLELAFRIAKRFQVPLEHVFQCEGSPSGDSGLVPAIRGRSDELRP